MDGSLLAMVTIPIEEITALLYIFFFIDNKYCYRIVIKIGFNVSDLQITTATTSGVLQALGGFKFPSFTAARPSSPSEGQTIYNTDTSALEV